MIEFLSVMPMKHDRPPLAIALFGRYRAYDGSITWPDEDGKKNGIARRGGGVMFKQKSSDDDLKAMCQKFRQAYSQWDESIRTTDMSSYDEAPDGGNELRELRLTWMQCLVRIQEIQPRTVEGAKAKLEVASIWSEWSDPEGCFLSEASREFEALSSEHQPRSALFLLGGRYQMASARLARPSSSLALARIHD